MAGFTARIRPDVIPDGHPAKIRDRGVFRGCPVLMPGEGEPPSFISDPDVRSDSIFDRRQPARRCMRMASLQSRRQASILTRASASHRNKWCSGIRPYVAQATVERLFRGSVGQLAGAREVWRDAVRRCPAVQGHSDEFEIVRPNVFRRATRRGDPRHGGHHLLNLDA